MFVIFKTPWERYPAGKLVDVELTLARRLIGLGVARHPEEAQQKTTPQPEMERYKQAPEPPEEKEEAAPAPKKKPPARYTRAEKAVKLEK